MSFLLGLFCISLLPAGLSFRLSENVPDRIGLQETGLDGSGLCGIGLVGICPFLLDASLLDFLENGLDGIEENGISPLFIKPSFILLVEGLAGIGLFGIGPFLMQFSFFCLLGDWWFETGLPGATLFGIGLARTGLGEYKPLFVKPSFLCPLEGDLVAILLRGIDLLGIRLSCVRRAGVGLGEIGRVGM